MIPHVPRERPMTRAEFDAAMLTWVKSAGDREWVGDEGGRGQDPWIHVRDEGAIYYLNADSKGESARQYVAMLSLDPTLDWTVVPNRNGRVNKVAFGSDRRVIAGFYLYADEA